MKGRTMEHKFLVTVTRTEEKQGFFSMVVGTIVLVLLLAYCGK